MSPDRSRDSASAIVHAAGGLGQPVWKEKHLTYNAVELPPDVCALWPYRPRFVNVNGWRMHYIDEGEGDPVVLLRGNPTWGFLYRDVIGPLIKSGRRVVVPDMIGFGLSEKPTHDQAHTLDGHIANLIGLVR